MRKINEMAMENIIVIKFKDGKNYAKLLPDGSFGILNEDESFKEALPFRDGFLDLFAVTVEYGILLM